MSDITVIGLGLMGAALARAIHGAGHGLTVWNRSPGRMRPFLDRGVAGAADASSAIAASPVVLICIDDYAATQAMLDAPEIAPLLSGRTLVQLSTGTPKEAREAAAWMAARGVAYLDGAILCGPDDIATEGGKILLSGDAAAHRRADALLQCLGGRVQYLGDTVGAASALDLAWLTTCYGRFLGIAHAANLCRSEGAGLDHFISLFPDRPDIQLYAQVIHDGSFDHATATLQVWGAALERIRQQGRDAGINTDFPDFAASLFRKAIAAGYGEQNVMSLAKVLQDT